MQKLQKLWALLQDRPRLQTGLYVALLVLIAIVTHWQWFNPSSILTFGDWQYRPDESVRQMFTSWQTWVPFEGTGTVNILMSGFPFRGVAWSSITQLGFSYDVATKLTLFIPTAIGGFLTAFLLAKRLFKDNTVAFFAALFYGTTPYYLSIQAGHLPINVVYALVPLLVYWLDNALERNELRYWIMLTLGFCVGIFYEVRIMYIVTFLLAAYAFSYLLLHQKLAQWRQFIRPLCIVGGLILLINLFWLIPTKLAAGAGIDEVAGRGLFGNSLFTMSQSLAVMKWNWSGEEVNRIFIAQQVSSYMWIVPVLAFSAFLLTAKKQLGKIMVFGCIALVGIFLTKQSAAPLTQAYSWLYSNFPGFVLFREASKFYLLTAFGFFGLIGYTLLALRDARAENPKSRRWRSAYFVAMAALLLVALVNLKPAATQELAGTFRNTPVPQDYQTFNNYIKKQPEFFRTYWLPRESWWGTYDNSHPRVRAVDTLEQSWAPFTGFKGGNGYELARKSVDILQQPFSATLFSNASIKYVVVPTRDTVSDDDFFGSFGNDREYFVRSLDQVSFLKRVDLGLKELAVYENTAYKPYVSTAAKLYTTTNANRPAEQANFITSKLGTPFATAPKKPNGADDAPLGKVTTLYDFSQQHDYFRQGRLEQTFNLAQGSYLFTGQKSQHLTYDITPDYKLTVYREASGKLAVNGHELESGTPRTAIGTKQLSKANLRNYYLGIGKRAIPLNSTPGTHAIGNTTEPVNIFSVKDTNHLQNPSFEQGPWQKEVQDCNPYDNRARLNMDTDGTKPTDGKRQLNLYAQSHVACTTQSDIPVNDGNTHLLQFDYRNEGGQQVGYKLTFNDGAKTVVQDQINTNGTNWQRLNINFTVPKGATKASLTILNYPGTGTKTGSMSSFDNFRLVALDSLFVSSVPPPTNAETPLPAGKTTLTYQDTSVDLRNRIKNPSFEEGTWQKKVGDCHNYDQKPQLKMSLEPKATAGNQALRLQASRHIACTSQSNIPVQGDAPYVFEFDFLAANTQQIRFRVKYDDPAQTAVDRMANVDKNGTWQHVSTSLQSPPGASKLTLTIYATPNSYGQRTTSVTYDNFRLTEVPAVNSVYHVVSPGPANLATPRSTKFKAISPTQKAIHVKGAGKPFYLMMHETYDKNWQLNGGATYNTVRSWLPGQASAKLDAKHFQTNGSLNAWYIDPQEACRLKPSACTKQADGTYDMNLTAEFRPQRWFNFGLLISSITFFGCFIYLIVDWVYRKNDEAF